MSIRSQRRSKAPCGGDNGPKQNSVNYSNSVAVIIAVGVNTDGRRDVLGMEVGRSGRSFCAGNRIIVELLK